MNEFSVNNKEYLLSINPSYKFIPLLSFIVIIIIVLTMFYFKTYDVYYTKGYLMCNKECNIILSANIDDINKINKANYIKIDNKTVDFKKINIGDIQVDEINKINTYNVNIEVNQLDNDYLNTFQDVKIYSNYESILNKIKKLII